MIYRILRCLFNFYSPSRRAWDEPRIGGSWLERWEDRVDFPDTDVRM